MFRKKPKNIYQLTKKHFGKKKKKKESSYILSLIVAPSQYVSIIEKIVKFIIYIALRIAIKPSKWKDPRKNYEIIDRTYKRIMSTDFIYIPSSIAFYLIMSFMPIISLIVFLYSLNLGDWLGNDALESVLGKFIPGFGDILEQVKSIKSGSSINVGAAAATALSLSTSTWISANGFSKLIFTQSFIYKHKFVGGYWMNKMRGIVLVFCFTLFLVLALVINILVNNWINSWNISYIAKEAFMYTFLIIGLFVMLFTGFILLFKFSPRYKIKIKDVVPGAMVATIPTAIFLTLFGTISSLWSYGKYGSIGVIMYIGMASLIITYFIFVGLTSNAAYYKTFVSNEMENKWTVSKK